MYLIKPIVKSLQCAKLFKNPIWRTLSRIFLFVFTIGNKSHVTVRFKLLLLHKQTKSEIWKQQINSLKPFICFFFSLAKEIKVP